MKTPKYNIGDVLYATCSYNELKGHKFQYLPTAFIIKEIKINSQDITYLGTQYSLIDKDKDVEIGTEEFPEKTITEKFCVTPTEIVKRISVLLEMGYSLVTEKVDKDRLMDVLHGK